MRTGYIRSFMLPHPDGALERFEIVELIGGRPHRSSEGWETHKTLGDARRMAEAKGIVVVDEP